MTRWCSSCCEFAVVALRVAAVVGVLVAAEGALAQTAQTALTAPVGAEGSGTPAALRWVFPTPETPAIVVAGAVLEVRVRLPTALTPPPGIQQPAALAGWMAELIAPTLAVDRDEPIEARYRVAASDVRPEGASSLVYRAKVPLAPWTAPGAYALALTTPGGRLAARALVRVVDATTMVPVRDAVKAQVPAVSVDSRVLAKAQDAAAFHAEYLDGVLHVRSAAGDTTVLLGASARRSIAVEGGSVAWYPNGSLGEARAPAVVGVLQLRSGQAARVTVTSATGATPVLEIPRGDVRARDPVRLAVTGAKRGARVAWRVGERHTAWGAAVLMHAFVGGGREEVVAFNVDPDGRGSLLRGAVEARLPAGCALHGRLGATGFLESAVFSGVGLLLLSARKRRRQRQSWNRLAGGSG